MSHEQSVISASARILQHIFIFAIAAFLLVEFPANSYSKTLRIVMLGDSLTAGYGLAPSQAYPVRLQAALKARGHDVEVVNAGVSGDTTAGGLARLDWSVPDNTDGVILELGANDALRGLPVKNAEKNLNAIVERLGERNLPVLLTGMLAPPNLGENYRKEFAAIFPKLANRRHVTLYPFFLDGVAAIADLNQPDGKHPNAKGVDILVQRTLPAVEEWLKTIRRVNAKSG